MGLGGRSSPSDHMFSWQMLLSTYNLVATGPGTEWIKIFRPLLHAPCCLGGTDIQHIFAWTTVNYKYDEYNKKEERVLWKNNLRFYFLRGRRTGQWNPPPFEDKIPGLDLTHSKVNTSEPVVPLADVLASLSLQNNCVHLPKPKLKPFSAVKLLLPSTPFACSHFSSTEAPFIKFVPFSAVFWWYDICYSAFCMLSVNYLRKGTAC